jgi:uncharacterized protein YbjT (DUF2867 family)
MSHTALVAGSTGLIGGQLLSLILEDPYYDKVIALSRKPLSLTHAKLQNILVEVDQINQNKDLNAEDVFCCLGTTIKQAKTKEAFRKVDFDYPLELAKILKANGAKQFLLVSALGSNKNSGVFYNRVKGEVEEAIAAVGYDSFHIFKPSLLVGPRKEQRSGEDAAKVFYKIFGFLIPKKYKEIESIKVARAMIALAKTEKQGLQIHESDVLQSY